VPAERCGLGLTDSMVRISVGIEDVEDCSPTSTAALAKV
jgi:cystathionine beta-lyase/cystathionine gamma-synthase